VFDRKMAKARFVFGHETTSDMIEPIIRSRARDADVISIQARDDRRSLRHGASRTPRRARERSRPMAGTTPKGCRHCERGEAIQESHAGPWIASSA
jgi:hypothetical protein